MWGFDADWERQALTLPDAAPIERRTARAVISDWASGALRWEVNGGFEQRDLGARYAVMGGGLTLATPRDRVAAHLRARGWMGTTRFGLGEIAIAGRSSTERRGFVVLASATLQGMSGAAPLDVWFAGDTGHARPTLLRGHPVLDDGKLRVDRLGRTLVSGSVETQRWWTMRGLLRIGGALFVDAARTASRLEASALDDVDIGAGARLALTGLPGYFPRRSGQGCARRRFRAFPDIPSLTTVLLCALS